MATVNVDRLREVKSLPQLLAYLRDELDWPIDSTDVDDLSFDYSMDELGLDAKHAAKIKEVKQLRPLTSNQPWGIFWINFEKKRLPMVVLRRILGSLITKSRTGAKRADQPSWQLHDLLFISSYGEEDHRNISFAHFSENPDREVSELPVLKVLGWDDQNSVMHLDLVANRLQDKLRWPTDEADLASWRRKWSEGFTDRYREAIKSSDVLIEYLAGLAAGIRKRVADTLAHESDKGKMRQLYQAVAELLIHDMTEDAFADMYAQTVAYGLLSARFSREADLTPHNLVQLTSVSNPFLENLLESLFRLNRGKWHFDVDEVGINDVLDLLRNTNIEAIKAAFNDENPEEDPVIRFYEGFLRAYDPEQRIQRGVFFTPRPVVKYIVGSVHELLQSEFGLEDGLASTATWADVIKHLVATGKASADAVTIPAGVKPTDPFVLILDPAVGTATFLYECIEVIERTMKEKWRQELGCKNWSDPEIKSRWQRYVPGHLLPRMFGYEIMMAPYAIAHVKLALKLGETGYQFRDGDRLHIYLTNSLEPPSDIASRQMADLFGTLAREAQEVNDVKRNKRFTVVIGNPPYANYSANLSPEARRIVDKYRTFGGSLIRERNQLQFERNLQDDFVKFIAVGENHICCSSVGILSYITNATMLASNSLRGMRENLTSTFSSLFELNLHGGVNENIVGVEDDANVFDIGQSVAIHVYVSSTRTTNNIVHYADMFGRREKKYGELLSGSAAKTAWRQIQPDAENHGFIPQDDASRETSRRLDSVFVQFGAGIKTNRDAVVIGFDDDLLLDAVRKFEPRLVRAKTAKNCVYPILYRPFDVRQIFYHESAVASRSFPTMKHVISGPNIGFITSSTWTTPERFSVNVSRRMVEMKTGTHDRGTTFFPFYRYESLPGGKANRVHNLSVEFVREWSAVTKTSVVDGEHGDLVGTTGVEDVLCWLYGLFHSPLYRQRFRTALAQGFPLVVFTANKRLLMEMAGLGGELVALHLMESPELDQPITKLFGPANPEIGRVGWSDNTVWLDAPAAKKGQPQRPGAIGFRGVPEDVWNFHIGGYQVCHKWLKDRKGRTLSADDIAHYQKIVVALNETIRLMAEIDEVIDQHGGWPGAFVTEPPNPHLASP